MTPKDLPILPVVVLSETGFSGDDRGWVSFQMQHKACLLSSDTSTGNWQEESWSRRSTKTTREQWKITSNYYSKLPISNSSTVDQVINIKGLAEGTEKEKLQNNPKHFAFWNLVSSRGMRDGMEGRNIHSQWCVFFQFTHMQKPLLTQLIDQMIIGQARQWMEFLWPVRIQSHAIPWCKRRDSIAKLCMLE